MVKTQLNGAQWAILLGVIVLLALVKVSAQEAAVQGVAENKSTPTFQDWKSQRLREALVELEKIQQPTRSPVEASAEPSQEGGGGTKNETQAKRQGYLDHSPRLAQRASGKPPLEEAEEKVQRARDLTVVDYLVAHLAVFRDDPEVMKLVAARMTPHEVLEMMKSYLGMLNPSGKVGDEPTALALPGAGTPKNPR